MTEQYDPEDAEWLGSNMTNVPFEVEIDLMELGHYRHRRVYGEMSYGPWTEGLPPDTRLMIEVNE